MGTDFNYVGVDASDTVLADTKEKIQKATGSKEIEGINTDFHTMKIPQIEGKSTMLFLGDTIGNIPGDGGKISFLRNALTQLKDGDHLILSAFTEQSPVRIKQLYDHEALYNFLRNGIRVAGGNPELITPKVDEKTADMYIEVNEPIELNVL
jgi:uncharacterized SAM-dependent methyltransferase